MRVIIILHRKRHQESYVQTDYKYQKINISHLRSHVTHISHISHLTNIHPIRNLNLKRNYNKIVRRGNRMCVDTMIDMDTDTDTDTETNRTSFQIQILKTKTQ